MEEYILVEVHGYKKFIREVNRKLNQGYIVVGGVTCPVRDLYVQALVHIFKGKK